MVIRRWYRGTAEPRIENGEGRIRTIAHRVGDFMKGDAPLAVKIAASAAAIILLPMFLVMTFVLLSSAFFALVAVRSKRRRGSFLFGRPRRTARIW